MTWWDIVKMSDEIEWLIDQLSDNNVIEMSGRDNANMVDLILEIPIDPRFIEWMNKKYKIELIGEPWRRGTRNKYTIEAIGA